ncbi:DUF6069 family protein [Micromonospora sp. C28SCA-DRY-2]|uniref:DUF6069 family protein n=1 Tax=Micromonospora sp. C28SCA-DRY-2 TaxID=3059522 RepID=UPI0026745C2C|nr:DUF6069 family protein [Micromonospora sp. C28SCA-DRY-2]MDO3703101.1 DUF6069 family protein [Micromonospora sp. C28SCA-DRY-2]
MTQTITRPRPSARWGRRAAALGLAVIAGLAVWLVCDPLAGLDLTVGQSAATRTVGPASIVVAALVVGAAGWALLAFLERRLRRGRRAWRITAWTVLALSLLGPLSSGATGGVLAGLIAMHVAVGTTLILGLAPGADAATAAG